MSDFDDVLERLLTDPGFQARLAADPAGALAGYRLSADELELLQAQAGGPDGGGQSRVEQRTSKASMFGLFSSIGSGIGDAVHGIGDPGAGHGLSGPGGLEQAGGRHAVVEPAHQQGGVTGHLHGAVEHGAHASAGGVQAHAGPGGAYASSGMAEAQTGEYAQYGQGSGGLSEASEGPGSYASAGFGQGAQGGYGGLAEAPDGAGGEPGHGAAGLAEASDPTGQSHVTEAHSSTQGTVYRSSSVHGSGGLAEASGAGQDGGAGGGRHGLGGALDGLAASRDGTPAPADYQGGHRGGIAGALGDGFPNGAGQAPTDGYHTRVDVDGDGRWDRHTYVNRADGGVDIVVDADGDGRAEFVGHDTDRDGLINSSELDTNHDGVMDQRYEDLNGDGWLDRRTR